MRHVLIGLALALLAGPALAEDALLKKGAATYKQFCSHCHGLDMVNPGTSSFDLRKFPKEDPDRFRTSVTKGKDDMPAMGDILYPEELDALWHYIRTRGGKEPIAEDQAAAEETPPLRLLTEGTLTACLPLNGGAMSGRRAEGGTGFDYGVVADAAARLGLGLEVVWFEGELEEESDPVRDTYALLAKPKCDVVPGVALMEGSIGQPPAARANVPRWKKLKRDEIRRPDFVDLVPLAATKPYARMEIGIVLRAPRTVGRLADLKGLRLGIEEGTLAGAITMAQAPADLRADAISLPPGPKFLWEMEAGRFDAALVSTGAYDFHKRQNRVTTLVLSDWRHPLGFNTGMALAADRDGLRAALDRVLGAMLADGTVSRIAAENAVHVAAPRAPDIAPRLTMRDLLAAH